MSKKFCARSRIISCNIIFTVSNTTTIKSNPCHYINSMWFMSYQLEFQERLCYSKENLIPSAVHLHAVLMGVNFATGHSKRRKFMRQHYLYHSNEKGGKMLCLVLVLPLQNDVTFIKFSPAKSEELLWLLSQRRNIMCLATRMLYFLWQIDKFISKWKL